MDARVFDSALSAAARVAFGVGAVAASVGCDHEPPPKIAGAELPTPTANPAPSGPRAATLPKRPPLHGDQPGDCSEARIQTLKLDSGFGLDTARVTPSDIACCRSLIGTDEHPAKVKDWDTMTLCCWMKDEKGDVLATHQMACTPWGPPAPPAMPIWLRST